MNVTLNYANLIQFDNIDFYIFIINVTAILKGFIKEKDIGINILVKNKEESSSNEVRKNGFICELGKDLQIKIDDQIFFYFTISKQIIDDNNGS